jgi:hypothetical protein
MKYSYLETRSCHVNTSFIIQWNPIMGSTQIGYNHAFMDSTRVEVTESDKRQN